MASASSSGNGAGGQLPRRRQKKASIRTEISQYYRDPMARKFNEVRHYLLVVQRLVDLREEGLTNKALSILAGELQMFYENKFGLYGTSRECVKLPAHVFEDFSSGGALCWVCLTCYEKKIEYGWDKFHFDCVGETGDQKKDDIVRKNVAMCHAIYKALVDKSILPIASIFFEKHREDQPTAELEQIVNSHGGFVTRRRVEATHVVLLNDPDKEVKQPDQDYLRTLKIKGNRAKVHWWYFPDSYDEWLSQNDIQGDPEPPRRPEGAWRVTERFLHDLEKFNEWMNENDYEEDDLEEEEAPPAEGGAMEVEAAEEDTKGDSSDGTEDDGPKNGSAKKRKIESTAIAAAAAAGPNRPAKVSKAWRLKERVERPKLLEHKVEGAQCWPVGNPKGLPASGIRAVEFQPLGITTRTNISTLQRPLLPSFPFSKEMLERFEEEAPKAQYVRWRLASWFDRSEIHENERKSFTEYFARKSKRKYDMFLMMRNHIIDAYAAKPYRQLTLRHCLDLIDGDISVTQRIHAFLEHWGLINFNITSPNQINYSAERDFQYPVLVPVKHPSVQLRAKHLPTPSDAKRPSDLLFIDAEPLKSPEDAEVSRLKALKGPPPLEKGPPMLKLSKKLSEGDEKRFLNSHERCVVSQRVLRTNRFVLRQDRSYCVSPEVYYNGEFPDFLCEDDFIELDNNGRLVNAEDTSSSKVFCSSTELQLLESVSNIDDINSSTSEKQKAIISFLKQPLLDSLTEQDQLLIEKERLAKAPNGKRLPGFNSKSRNPILSQITIVSSKLSPAVGSAMAKRVLLELGLREEKEAETKAAKKAAEAASEADNEGKASDGEKAEELGRAKASFQWRKSSGSLDLTKEVQEDMSRKAFASGAEMALALAAEEERKMKLLIRRICSFTMQRISIKMKELEKLDSWLKIEMGSVGMAKIKYAGDLKYYKR
mmetsp:Transcript_25817/g.62195  ORF Transcript_25817/g.62195 Transcript_25817/m.62195 type:complete len:936 (+) Transcript_25817:88-2895(+)|eukprot:CAMPEP_0114496456 /NCGR_PEP_ID=MMETSP0109-20121206/5779_1 /TAXON_ID=29199 /ORGANISM="Chlorarachnion reptans, Strain CCCM449" /LENGTH=935 /DNA_ID=CAMNT_0001673729 /DNA_START=57 /DNA_END=2864 /DNA_ORIENTATION=+